MVYDPVRDCDIPSPAVSRRSSFREFSQPQPPPPPTPPQPPVFQYGDREQRSPVPSVRPPSGAGLRSLLNDDGPPSRRGSDHTVSSYDDDHSHRSHLSKLLNEPQPPPPSLLRRGSASSAPSYYDAPAQPSVLSSPSISLHPGPSAAAARASRSPLMQSMALPLSSPPATYDPYGPPGGYPPGPSSRRSSIDPTIMPPPSDRFHRPPDIHTPGSAAHSLRRSPSVSVSPRSSHTVLPQQQRVSSRPSSARSSSTPFAPPSAGYAASPDSTRRGSDDAQQAHPSSRPSLPGRGANGGSSSSVPGGGSSRPRTPYNPAQPSHSSTIHRPIDADELAELRSQAVGNNPLRRRGRRPAPLWSAPSPRNSMDGYDDAGPSHSGATSRRGSMAEQARPVPPPPPEPVVAKKRPSDEASPERSGPRRRTDNHHGNAAYVASHYNSRPEVGVEHREFSPIIGLKKYNNWVKSVLIGKFAHRARQRGAPGAKVLDVGCGKGGDLNKWKQARISLYVGMDIAATSIDQARNRYETMRGARFDAAFYAHDCYSNPLSDVLPDSLLEPDLYDNVSMQFCMHYAFETASKARMMMENVSRYLRRGGIFIGTIPNSTLLLERLEEIPEGEDLRFGNTCYSIEFAERHHQGVYGHEYRFYLEDAVEDVPEYIVDWDNFVSLAREYGLELIYRKTFNDVLQEEQSSRDFGPLLGKMGVINDQGESAMDSDQWEAANLYMAFAFEKVR